MDPENRTPLDDATLGALYASTRDEAHTPVVAAAIEARILAAARTAPRRRFRTVPWASAAVVVLALGVAWQVARVEQSERAAPVPRQLPAVPEVTAARQQAPAPPAAASPTAISPASAPPAAPVAAKAMAVARLADEAETSAESAQQDSAGIVAADTPAAARAAEATVSADPRLDRVRALLREGKREEARAALAALHARETELVPDAELDALLDAPAAEPR
jgi:cytoskeletal protein RodZ